MWGATAVHRLRVKMARGTALLLKNAPAPVPALRTMDPAFGMLVTCGGWGGVGGQEAGTRCLSRCQDDWRALLA